MLPRVTTLFTAARVTSFALIFLASAPLKAQSYEKPLDLAGYYDDVYVAQDEDFLEALRARLRDHRRLEYSGGSLDVWNAIMELDEDPNDSSAILTIYSNRSISKKRRNHGGRDSGTWNREHLWPKSHGVGYDRKKPAFTDLHHIFASQSNYNSARSSKFFDYGQGQEWPALGVNEFCNICDLRIWEPWEGVKGNVARAMFYMDLRYEGQRRGEPDLELTDDCSQVRQGGVKMGKLSTLLEWHREDPVDERELRRNQLVFENWQGNRNPFIDHPEWAERIWGSGGNSGEHSSEKPTTRRAAKGECLIEPQENGREDPRPQPSDYNLDSNVLDDEIDRVDDGAVGLVKLSFLFPTGESAVALEEEHKPPEPLLEEASPMPSRDFSWAVRITRALPNPSGNDDYEEWIEVENFGEHEISLDGWRLEDRSGHSWELSGSLDAGATVVRKRRARHEMRLGNNGDRVELLSPNGDPVDEISWSKAKSGRVFSNAR